MMAYQMPQKMHHALGYDAFGHNPDLLSEADRQSIEMGDWKWSYRFAVCDTCGIEHWAHPAVQGALWLTRTCKGLVRLRRLQEAGDTEEAADA